MPRKVYPESLKEEICKRIMSTGPDHLSFSEAAKKYNINKTTLQYWVSKKHHVLMPDLEAVPPAPVPSNIGSILDAIAVARMCERQGFDSPESGLLCRQYGVKMEEVKAFSSWVKEHITDEAIERAPTLLKTLNDTQACLQNSNAEIAELKTALNSRNQALAEVTTELVVRKKLMTILS